MPIIRFTVVLAASLSLGCGSVPQSLPSAERVERWGFTAPWDPRSAASVAAHGRELDAIVTGWITLDSITGSPSSAYSDSTGRDGASYRRMALGSPSAEPPDQFRHAYTAPITATIRLSTAPTISGDRHPAEASPAPTRTSRTRRNQGSERTSRCRVRTASKHLPSVAFVPVERDGELELTQTRATHVRILDEARRGPRDLT